ncbi:MAG: hypothetical protein SFW08_14405 [Gemmatimonadaceae bacterium]|nr:hypothetical protein [Gemmatimonadaceae bacterium]
MPWVSLILRLTVHAVLHPLDGLAMVRVGWRFRRRGWFARVPFLPLPSMPYVRWRMYTAFGAEDAVPTVEDVVSYARWAVRG